MSRLPPATVGNWRCGTSSLPPRYVVGIFNRQHPGPHLVRDDPGADSSKGELPVSGTATCGNFSFRPEYGGSFGHMHPGIAKALKGDFSALPDHPNWDDLQVLALSINGYELSEALELGHCGDIANAPCRKLSKHWQVGGEFSGTLAVPVF